ncbi:MAG: restriction endonuclease subunit S [Pseudonocardiaceae bacterium]
MGRLNQVADAWPSNVDKHSVDGELPVRLCNYTDVYKNPAIVEGMNFMAATASPEQIERFRLEVGDTVITKDSETSDDIGIPAFVEYAAHDLICGYHLSIVRPNRAEADPKFIYWALSSRPTMDQWAVLASGVTRVGIKSGDLSKVAIPLPSVEEQRSIADYLDRETSRIDTLIEEQQRLIEMLRERREATIRRALTAGIDGADTVPSGVELLGPIPKNWRVVPTRHLCTITTGSEDSGNATDDGDFPFYVRGRAVLRSDTYSFDGEAVMTPGDGQGGTGKVFHYYNGKFEAHQRVYVFKDFVEVTGLYFYYFLSTFLRPIALAGSNTVTMESLRRPLLADFKVAVPPVDEQRRIAAYIDEQTTKVDQLIAETERFIELSKERRVALITAAVTGQIDVREMA